MSVAEVSRMPTVAEDADQILWDEWARYRGDLSAALRCISREADAQNAQQTLEGLLTNASGMSIEEARHFVGLAMLEASELAVCRTLPSIGGTVKAGKTLTPNTGVWVPGEQSIFMFLGNWRARTKAEGEAQPNGHGKSLNSVVESEPDYTFTVVSQGPGPGLVVPVEAVGLELAVVLNPITGPSASDRPLEVALAGETLSAWTAAVAA